MRYLVVEYGRLPRVFVAYSKGQWKTLGHVDGPTGPKLIFDNRAVLGSFPDLECARQALREARPLYRYGGRLVEFFDRMEKVKLAWPRKQ